MAPAQAQAPRPNGYPVTNVNLRAGPGTYYPALLVVPSRAPISILGCLGDYTWCDVIFQGNRGWMRSIYLQGWYRGYYYSLRDYAPRLGYRVVSFDLGRLLGCQLSRPSVLWRPGQMGRRDRLTAKARPIAARSTTGLRLTAIGSGCRANMSGCRRMSDRYWRPYTVGRWAFTDRYGWMWVSQRAVRLGDLSLRTLGILESGRLVLGAGQSLGAGLGVVALVERLSRLGAAAAGL